MPYKAFEIAEYIVWHENEKHRFVNPLRLQKLLYFVQAHRIAVTGQPLFTDRMEAWDYGPVVLDVFRKYRFYGSGIIPFLKEPAFAIAQSDMQRINEMLDYCASFSNTELLNKIHAQAPWQNAYHRSSRWGLDCEITPDAIREFFTD